MTHLNFKDNKIIALDNQAPSGNTLFPKLPFTLTIVASKGGGKTSLLLNMLLNPHLFKGKFNRIIVVSPTAKLDEKMNILRETADITVVNHALLKAMKVKKKIEIADFPGEEHEYENRLTDSDFLDNINETFLPDIIAEQKQIITTYGKKVADTVLIILDDLAAERKFYNSKITKSSIFNSRHYKISMILTTQVYNCIPPQIRINNSNLILFQSANKKEIQKIYEENNGKLTFNEFYQLYEKITSEPYGFLQCNYQNTNNKRYVKNLEEFIL